MDTRQRALLATTLAIVMAASAAAVFGAEGTRAWIDQPLPGAVLPVAPTPVTIHAASDVGIAKVRWLVDGQPAGEMGGPTGDLVTLQWTWQPPGLGTHLLTVIAEATDGSSSGPISAGVTFVGPDEFPPTPSPAASGVPAGTASPSAAASREPGSTRTATPGATPTPSPPPGATPKPTPKPTPTLTPSPTPTPRPTPPPCEPQGPQLVLPEYDSGVDSATPTFEWLYNDPPPCEIVEFRIHVSASRDFQPLNMSGEVPGDTFYWTAPEGLEACVDYWWRVVPVGPDGTGEPSAIGLFHLIGRTCP